MYTNLTSQDNFIASYTADSQDTVNLAKNLSLILQDLEGNLTVTNSGTLVRNLDVLNGNINSNFYEVITPQGGILPTMTFDRKLSLKASTLFTKLKNNSSNLILYGNYQKSPLLDAVSSSNSGVNSYLCAIYLELYVAYHELLKTDMISDIQMAESDIARIRSNCYWINWYLQDTKDGSDKLINLMDLILKCVNELSIFIHSTSSTYIRYTEHIIRDGDTIENIAYRYFGNTDNIEDIVSLNNLVYPYIVGRNDGFGDSVVTSRIKAGTFKCGTRKSGEIVETWLGSENLPTLFPEDIITAGSFYSGERSVGDTFGTPIYSPDGSKSAICGTFKCGTVKSGQVGILVDEEDPIEDNIFLDGDVLSWGDTILLPILEGSNGDEINSLMLSDIELQHTGNSLTDNIGGTMSVDNCGDLSVIQEENVVAQDIRHRMMCVKGDLIQHPEFSSGITEFIGNNSLGLGMEQKAIAEYTRTCLSDSRVSSVTDVSCDISNSTISLSGTIKYMKKDILVSFTGSL